MAGNVSVNYQSKIKNHVCCAKCKQKLLLSTAYFAPIQYYSKILSDNSDVVIERHENYCKQSYRNRCTIYTANGLLDLVVPVVKSSQPKIPITEVQISYDMPWQKQHFKAIESAYRRSPFYEFFIDDLMAFFTNRYICLYDFNMQILRTMCSLMKIPFRVRESVTYSKPDSEQIIDMRNSIHPKIDNQISDNQPFYTQVFAEKWGFKPNLSILDLLFNTGRDAKNILQKVI